MIKIALLRNGFRAMGREFDSRIRAGYYKFLPD